MSAKVALVAGASGMVGKRLAQELILAGWTVLGLCRRPPESGVPFETLPVDLTDAADCKAALASRSDITHIFYAGRYTHTTTAPEPVEINVNMLRNLLDVVEPVAPGLRHVHAVHGTKVYGSTLGPYKTPAKESDPRVLADTFYYGQEDLLATRQQGKKWNWTTSRPQAVCDTDPTIVRNIARLIAVYAAISRELGMALHFPGKTLAYTSIYQVTDARQLARALIWISEDPACANQKFNVTNGDYFRWTHIWPSFADHFGMKLAPPRPIRLGEIMADKAPVWNRVVERHKLKHTPFDKAAIWPYGDFILGHEYDVMSDFTKLRSLGFHDVIDSEKMFLEIFNSLRNNNVVP